MSLMDIDNVIATSVNSSVSNSGNSATVIRSYLCALTRKHSWRNSEQNAACHIEAYCLYPRRDQPSYTSVTSTLSAMANANPPNSNVATVGWGATDPNGWQQDFTDESGMVIDSTKIVYSDPAVTPYQNTALCQMYKIRRLKLNTPMGRRFSFDLEPGQSCTYEGKRLRPYSCSFAKFGLSGLAAEGLTLVYQTIRDTPIIVLMVKGTPSHDTMTKTLVGLGPANLDYVQDFRFEYYNLAINAPQISNPISSAPVVAIAEQVEVVTASVGIEALA